MKKLSAALVNTGLVLAPFLLLEGLFRLLPVSDTPPLLSVNEQTPVVRYQPNVDYRYSRDWNFSIVTHRHSNNYGFIHAADFRPDEPAPLMALIGDSFVEANVVDAGKGVAEILDAAVAGTGRVYGIGVSGAPLSQYLMFADYARRTFRPQAMTIAIIGNDFDESLLKYKTEPRFHYFTADGSLTRVDYRLSASKQILRHSATLRYVMFNLDAPHRLAALRDSWRGAGLAQAEVSAELEQRIADSQRAVDYFLDQLPERAGLGAQSILLVLDALRPQLYSAAALAKIDNGFQARLRRYFAAQATARGYQVIDLQPVFIARHELDGSTFEAAPTDSHWNALAHRIVAEQVRSSALFDRMFRQSAGLQAASAKAQAPVSSAR
jgi:hypothetical protein